MSNPQIDQLVAPNPGARILQVQDLVKVYSTGAGGFTALKGITFDTFEDTVGEPGSVVLYWPPHPLTTPQEESHVPETAAPCPRQWPTWGPSSCQPTAPSAW